ncbi:MAG: hypothetical protein FJ276_16485, partial [Planctomycetes bacterium]|nr:hypothetical protein [Planctomycetota bacterium]
MRAWIGTALLAGSWLVGLGHFEDPNRFTWFCALVAGALLLTDVPLRFPSRAEQTVLLPLLLLAVGVFPVPYKSIPLLLTVATVLSIAPLPGRWPRLLARGAASAGLILVAQAIAMLGYQSMTARSHELPRLFLTPIAWVAHLVGADAALQGGTLSLGNALETSRVVATWELLFDPATVGFLAGGVVLLLLYACGRRCEPGRGPGRSLVILLALVLAWAPLRLALVAALVLQRLLRVETVAFSNTGELLVSTWLHLGLVCGFAVLAGSLIPKPVGVPNDRLRREAGRRAAPWKRPLSAGLCGVAVAVLTIVHCWVPLGERKAGRVMVVERHSNWEPTTEPYGTQGYGEAGSYNYAAIYEYCRQHYEMSQLLETDAIDDGRLGQCDVLIVKTPTARYSAEEVASVVRFVERGGSLLLIGDHTNVFNMNTYLNDLSRHFGFTFRNDLLFRVGQPYRQAYRPPHIAHPVLRHVPPMHFAVSCSIDPGRSAGTMVVRNTGLWSLPPAYHESNYHPQAEYRPDMQYGAWCQLWSTVHGKGRVLGFADSTLFSNFCVFQPGKRELFVGMLEWLNRTSPLDRRAIRLALTIPAFLLAAALLAPGCWQCWRDRKAWLPHLAGGCAGWSVAAMAVVALHEMPVPPKHRVHHHVVVDRTVSEVPLSTGAFADHEEGGGYGMLEQWIPRV